jgi:hypothetical protein
VLGMAGDRLSSNGASPTSTAPGRLASSGKRGSVSISGGRVASPLFLRTVLKRVLLFGGAQRGGA